jgi:hypothetical protein
VVPLRYIGIDTPPARFINTIVFKHKTPYNDLIVQFTERGERCAKGEFLKA